MVVGKGIDEQAMRDAGGLLAAKLVDLRMDDPKPMQETLEVLASEPKRALTALVVMTNMVASYAEQTLPRLEGLVDYMLREIQKGI